MRSPVCVWRRGRFDMARESDLTQFKRLVALCDARHRLAVQEQARAEAHCDAAQRRRTESETAVVEAERFWQRAMTSGLLGPDSAAAAGEALVARAGVLMSSIDREAEARRALANCKDARSEARARLKQVEEVSSLCRREALHRRDELLLAQIEDRIAYRWKRA
ncbi:hypothetical protein [Sphingomonas koreensis]